MADATPLQITDAESVYNAVLSLVLQYPNYPSDFTANAKTIKWNSIGTDESIGLYPLQGGIYLNRYVSGSYTAQFPFQIVFKSSPSTNKEMVSAQLMVDGLSTWLEKCGIGFKDTHVTLEAITRTSPSYPLSQDEKATEYAVNMQLKYYYKV